MSEPEKKAPEKVVEGPPTSAGFEAAQERADQRRGLPFDPEGLPVDELRAKLEEVDSLAALDALRQADARPAAAPHYERRLKALTPKEG